jgi:hypothetical protein
MRLGNLSRRAGWCAAVLFLWPGPSLRANLLICVQRDRALYVAGDTMALKPANAASVRSTRIFQLDEVCCVSITGFAGPVLMDTNKGYASALYFPVELGRLCSEENDTGERLPTKINRIITRFGARYHDALRNQAPSAEPTAPGVEGIGVRISFLGYDESKREFFATSYRFSETKRATLELMFDRAATNQAARLSLQGATGFLEALISGKTKLPDPAGAEFRGILAGLTGSAPLSDDRLIECLLRMFQLQRQHSAASGYGDAAIDEPITISKITRDRIVKLR